MSQSWPSLAGPDDVSLVKLTDRFDALRSSFAGTARPSSPVAGQLFYDTDSGPIMEICTNATGPVWAGLATVLAASELLTKILTVDGAGSGLDADLLDGQSSAYYLAASAYTAADVLSKLLTVDGAASTLDADLLDGQQGSYYQNAGNLNAGTILAARMPAFSGGDVTSSAGSVSLSIAASTILTKLLTVDGTGTGLDADLLDGQEGSYYRNATNLNAGTVPAAQMPAMTGDATSSAGAVALTLAAAAISGKTAITSIDHAADYGLFWDATDSLLKKALLQYIGAGKQAFWVPAGAMSPRANTPCATLATFETATNRINWDHLAFDATTAEYAVFDWRAPKAIGTGTFTAIFVWSHPSTTTNFGVAWELAGHGRGDGDAMEVAHGTAVTVTDTGGTTDTVYVTAVSGALTMGGTFAAEDVLKFQVNRAPANGSDNLAVDARLHGIWLIFTTTQNTEQ